MYFEGESGTKNRSWKGCGVKNSEIAQERSNVLMILSTYLINLA